MSKAKLLPQQTAELKRWYLQKTDAQLAAIIGSDVKTVKAELARLKLERGPWTENKLKGAGADIKNIDVKAQTVSGDGLANPAGSMTKDPLKN